MSTAEGLDASQLSAQQQSLLEQYMAVTNQEVQLAVPLLDRSQWNLEIAIAKFFDGEGPDLVAEAMAAQANATVHTENLQESFLVDPPRRQRPQTEAAPRVVPRRPFQIPFFFSLLLAPFNFGYKMVSVLYRSVLYIASFLPPSIRPRTVTQGLTAGFRSVSGRKMLLPRDTAARFKREFEEEYGQNLPFFEGGSAQAFDAAKSQLKFLLMILISPEHDDTETFVRDTLLSPEVVAFITNPCNDIILWGGNVLDSEAYQVSVDYKCTKFPFTALVCLTPKEGSTRMGIIKRLAGTTPASRYLHEIKAGIDKYNTELAAVRAERRSRDAAQALREQQDSAYERSLAIDRERARARREAQKAEEEAHKQAEEDAQKAAELEAKKQLWRRWRAGTIDGEPDAKDPETVRLAIKMPESSDAGRIVRRFKATASLEDVYAFVECYDILGQEEDSSSLDDRSKPEGYEHKYNFQLASIIPRHVYKAASDQTVRSAVGRSANLIVEDIVVEDNE